jgi:uncharacterized protein YbjT (DUF2867 family)
MIFTILQPTCFMEIWLSPALGFDPARGTATVCGSGRNKVSWISYLDVARFATAVFGNPAATNAVLRLGGPNALSPVEVVSMAEQLTNKPIAIQPVPEEALQSQYDAASDSLQRSMSALMLYCARGDVIDTAQVLSAFPEFRRRAVRDHLRQILA